MAGTAGQQTDESNVQTAQQRYEAAAQAFVAARDDLHTKALDLVRAIARVTWPTAARLILETSDQSYTTGFDLDDVHDAQGSTAADFDPNVIPEDLETALSDIDWDVLPDNVIELD